MGAKLTLHLGHRQDMLDRHRRLLSRMLVADQHEAAAARRDLLHVGHRLLEHRVARRDDDHRHRFVDERDRPVLEFAGGVTFGVDVAQFLELERAFERERIGRAAAEVEHVAGARDRMRELLGGGLELERLGEKAGRRDKLADQRRLGGFIDRPARLARG